MNNNKAPSIVWQRYLYQLRGASRTTGARHIHLHHRPLLAIGRPLTRTSVSLPGVFYLSAVQRLSRGSEVKSCQQFKSQSLMTWNTRRGCHQRMTWEQCNLRRVGSQSGKMKNVFFLFVFRFTDGSSFIWDEWIDHFVKKIQIWGSIFFRFGVVVCGEQTGANGDTDCIES